MASLENVRLRFDPRGIAGLSGVTLDLPEGSVTALLGPNGSGKTTLLRIFSGELTPESGKVQAPKAILFGGPLIVPSDTNVQTYLIGCVGAETNHDKKIQLSRDLADVFEFTFQLRQNIGELSAGQRQKVLLAGELLKAPGFLLLDEPFAHLDPHTRSDILRSLFTYVRRQNLTVLWVTHDLEEASRFSDRLMVLQHGKIEQAGTPEELFLSPKNIFVAQFMGYENFFPVKRGSSGWITPWGEKSLSGDFPREALLVVPAHAWEISEGSPVRGKVEEVYFRGTQRILEIATPEKKIVVAGLPGESKVGESLSLVPRFSVSFLIGL